MITRARLATNVHDDGLMMKPATQASRDVKSIYLHETDKVKP